MIIKYFLTEVLTHTSYPYDSVSFALLLSADWQARLWREETTFHIWELEVSFMAYKIFRDNELRNEKFERDRSISCPIVVK